MKKFLLFLACLEVIEVSPGHSKMCMVCDHVGGPAECSYHVHCPGACVTDVHHRQGRYVFTYSCGTANLCYEWNHNIHHHADPHSSGTHHGDKHVCKECCHGNLCSKHSCSQFINKTWTISTTTTTTTTPVPTRTTITRKSTTAVATATSSHRVMQTTAAQHHCVDSADPGFTCTDMKYFGYCNPSAGAGYVLAQQRCPKYCGFCI